MKRTIYEAPRTILYKVEVEGVICGSADVDNSENPSTGTIKEQTINNNDFGDYNDIFSEDGWK